MAKSGGNFLTLENALIKNGIDPLIYRFATLQVHYRKPMEYSKAVIKNAADGFNRLRNQIRFIKSKIKNQKSKLALNNNYKNNFIKAINNDLNMPKALAVVQGVLRSGIDSKTKLDILFDFDRVLGLDFDTAVKKEKLPREIENLIKSRGEARKRKDFKESDKIRGKIENEGYMVEDTKEGMRVYKK